jgi:O-antigen ligase
MTFADASEPRRTAPRGFFIPTIISIFVMMILVLIAPIMTADGTPDGSGNTLRQAGYALLFLATVWMVGGFKRPRKLLAPPLMIILAIGWCWLSLFWALEPSITIRRLLLTTLVLWIIFLAVEECGFDRTIKAMMICLVALLIANYIAIVAFPYEAIHQAGISVDAGIVGDWKGVLPQKNFTGACCALTIMLFLFAGKQVNLILRIGVIAASAFFLVMSQSKTSMGMLILSAAVGGIYYVFNPRLRMVLIPVVALAGVAMMMYSITAWDEMLGPFARHDGLTGRVQIWPYLISYATDHPYTGAGYGSFWNIGTEGPIYSYSRNWVSELSNGHNGYLDLLVQVGWPGLILAVLATMVIPMWKLLSNSEVSKARGGLLIALLIFCIGHNITETSLFERDVIVGVFLIFTVALVEVVTRRSSQQRGPSSERRRSRSSLARPQTGGA